MNDGANRRRGTKEVAKREIERQKVDVRSCVVFYYCVGVGGMGIIWWSVESMVMIIIYCYFIILSDSHIFILLFIFWTSFTHKLFFVDSILLYVPSQ